MAAKLDTILIKDLHLRCIIGINDEERRNQQDVVINIELQADLSKAAASDRIEDTVDYKKVKKNIITLVEASRFNLVEKLAEEIANLCLVPELVKQATVQVEKPGALRFARSVGIQITRNKASETHYIGVGSNIEPERNIRDALLLLSKSAKITGISTFYRSRPLPNPATGSSHAKDPSYYNGVFRVQSSLSAEELQRQILHPIESALGRVRTQDKYDSRTIDLDVLDLLANETRERPFVAIPLLELEPGIIEPKPDCWNSLSNGEPVALIEFTHQLRITHKLSAKGERHE